MPHLCFFGLNFRNPRVNAIFGGMYQSFWNALDRAGYPVTYTESVGEIKGDILIVPVGEGQEVRSSQAMSAFNGPVILYVPPARTWFYESFLKRWKHRILFAYGTDESRLSHEKFESLGMKYLTLPFASDPRVFYPMEIGVQYDIIFAANANSGVGRYRYIKPLMERAKERNWNILMLGQGWEAYGYPYQIVAHGKLLNVLYNMSKIGLNIHNDIQYSGKQMDANNRVFDLAMCGCLQVGNARDLVLKYLREDECVVEDDPQALMNLLEKYLQNDDLRHSITKKALDHAKRSHTWDSRADSFVSCLENYYPAYTQKANGGIFNSIARSYDQMLPPTYLIREKIARLMKRK